ncbi:MAG: DUF58 domain-containing protein [Ignavibacteriae bacterium]|nr:MAG: DUF58 domain-containing protein [Ignavibacteriota bacterium]
MRYKYNKKNLEPSVIAKLKTLELKAKAVVEGFMVGHHKSPYHGFSVEFSQHRPYNQGDSIKNLDWKVYAKTERYYIKQYEEETNLRANIILDSSKSMDYKNQAAITKFEYAEILAASLAYLLLMQQDAIGLGVYSDSLKSYLRPRSKKTYLKQILTEIGSIKPNSKTNTAESINEIFKAIKSRGLVIIISDFLDDVNTVLHSLKKFYYKKNEVIIFHILDPIEKTFSFDKDAVFVDIETNETITTQPIQIQKAYIDAMQEYLRTLKNGCENYGFDYNLIDTSTNFDMALLSFFKKRARLN